MEGILNNLIVAIEEFNVEESIYWAHLLKQQEGHFSFNNLTILNELFKGFKLGNEELSLILTNLIWGILKNEDFPVIHEKYRNELFEGITRTKDEPVLKLCLRIIFELGIKNGHEIDEKLIKESLKLLLSTNYTISSYLIELLTNTVKYENSLMSRELLSLYSNISINDSVIKFRFIELFSRSGGSGSGGSLNSSLSQTFFHEIKLIISSPNEDPLMTVNVIQIIQDCINRREQFRIFLIEGIFDLLLKLIENDNENENSIISCKILDLLGNCAILKCFDYEFIELNSLDRRILSICEEDEIKRVSGVFCLATFAILSRNPKNLLLNFDNFLFHEISSVQLSALNGIGIYFESNTEGLGEGSLSNEISSNFKFEFLLYLNSKGFFNWLIQKINSTFIEEKSSAYFTLKSILSIEENLKFTLDNCTIFSILLQRNLDDSPIGLKWKYGILEQIYLNSNLFNCLNDPLKEQVKKYLGQGVTFVPKSSRVAFEAE